MIAIMLFAIGNVASAQNNSRRQRLSREQLAEKQARYIAESMALDEDVTNRFVTTFCQYLKDIWALGPKMGSARRNAAQPKTDAEAGQQIQEKFERSQKILEIRQKYYKEYSKFLTQKQISKVYELERQSMKRLAGRNKGNKQR